MNVVKQSAFVLPEHYLEMEYRSPYKSEYLDGEIRAMSYTSDNHGLIVGGITLAIGDCLRKKGCKIYPADRLIYSEPCNLFAYPDVVILCASPKFRVYRGEMQALTNPSVLIEVLSESTAEVDRLKKLPCYKQLPSVRHILLVESERKAVEHHQRVESNQWLVSELAATDHVALDDCLFSIEKFYDQVEFPDATPDERSRL